MTVFWMWRRYAFLVCSGLFYSYVPPCSRDTVGCCHVSYRYCNALSHTFRAPVHSKRGMYPVALWPPFEPGVLHLFQSKGLFHPYFSIRGPQCCKWGQFIKNGTNLGYYCKQVHILPSKYLKKSVILGCLIHFFVHYLAIWFTASVITMLFHSLLQSLLGYLIHCFSHN
jgi:hypothetical protein